MTVLRRLVVAAARAGLLTGLLVTVMHQVGTVPVILRAEAYKRAADAGHGAGRAAQSPGGAHDQAAHAHEDHGWEPRDGLERTAYTALANVLAAIGYGLLLGAGFALQGKEIMAGRAVVGPGGVRRLHLDAWAGPASEVPGTEAAPLLSRQVWWAATAALTGSGLALLAYGKQWPWSVLAVLLIALPHLWDAPQPIEPGSAAPETLAHQFVLAVTAVSFLSWAVLGSSTAYF